MFTRNILCKIKDTKIFEILKNNSGAALVEATIVFPMTILALIGIICIIVFLTSNTFTQVDVHKYLREYEGVKSETRYTYDDNKVFKISNDTNFARKVYKSSGITKEKGGFLLPEILETKVKARVYEIDEKKVIRTKDLVFKKKNN